MSEPELSLRPDGEDRPSKRAIGDAAWLVAGSLLIVSCSTEDTHVKQYDAREPTSIEVLAQETANEIGSRILDLATACSPANNDNKKLNGLVDESRAKVTSHESEAYRKHFEKYERNAIPRTGVDAKREFGAFAYGTADETNTLSLDEGISQIDLFETFYPLGDVPMTQEELRQRYANPTYLNESYTLKKEASTSTWSITHLDFYEENQIRDFVSMQQWAGSKPDNFTGGYTKTSNQKVYSSDPSTVKTPSEEEYLFMDSAFTVEKLDEVKLNSFVDIANAFLDQHYKCE